jgi:hypothetical protein
MGIETFYSGKGGLELKWSDVQLCNVKYSIVSMHTSSWCWVFCYLEHNPSLFIYLFFLDILFSLFLR